MQRCRLLENCLRCLQFGFIRIQSLERELKILAVASFVTNLLATDHLLTDLMLENACKCIKKVLLDFQTANHSFIASDRKKIA